jgi:hypothetical protein
VSRTVVAAFVLVAIGCLFVGAGLAFGIVEVHAQAAFVLPEPIHADFFYTNCGSVLRPNSVPHQVVIPRHACSLARHPQVVRMWICFGVGVPVTLAGTALAIRAGRRNRLAD